MIEPGHPKTAVPNLKHPLISCQMKWSCFQPPPPYKWAQPRVVIVGAGLAGLAAGWRLHTLGVKDFVILEALERPGGRVHTSKLGGTKVDLGSGLLYGCTITNPLFNISVAENVIDSSLERKSVTGPSFTLDGGILYDIERPFEIFRSALEAAARGSASLKKSNTSLGKAIDERIKESLSQHSGSVSTVEALSIMNGLRNEIRVRWGDDLDSLSTENLGSPKETSPSIIMLNKIGANKVLDPFLAVVKDKIRYKKPVQSIRWREAFLEGSLRGGVLCCDGEEFHSDFVISTVSLGVLKSQAPLLFTPSLPKDKLDAIDLLGFGPVNKIFLEYDPPFWVPNEGLIRIGWDVERLSKRDSWLKGVGVIHEVSSTVLGLSMAGREATWTESLSDHDIAEELTTFLRKLTRNPSIPCPKSIIRSRWCSDIFFNGGQSYLGLESCTGLQEVLGSPLPEPFSPVLLFAGEATAVGRITSMAGAVASGLREADRIVEVCERFRGPPRAEEVDHSLKPCPATVAATSSA